MGNIKFSNEECRSIINLSDILIENHSSTIFKGNSKDFDYFYYTVERVPTTQWIFDKLHLYLIEYFPESRMDIHPQLYLHKYLPGCRFEIHNDSTTHPDQLINIGVCLNDNYKGGEFVFYKPYEILSKVTGTIYHLDSKRDHEVLRIEEGERWSLITFLKAKDLGVVSKSLI
jgi:hypothetical protein